MEISTNQDQCQEYSSKNLDCKYLGPNLKAGNIGAGASADVNPIQFFFSSLENKNNLYKESLKKGELAKHVQGEDSLEQRRAQAHKNLDAFKQKYNLDSRPSQKQNFAQESGTKILCDRTSGLLEKKNRAETYLSDVSSTKTININIPLCPKSMESSSVNCELDSSFLPTDQTSILHQVTNEFPKTCTGRSTKAPAQANKENTPHPTAPMHKFLSPQAVDPANTNYCSNLEMDLENLLAFNGPDHLGINYAEIKQNPTFKKKNSGQSLMIRPDLEHLTTVFFLLTNKRISLEILMAIGTWGTSRLSAQSTLTRMVMGNICPYRMILQC